MTKLQDLKKALSNPPPERLAKIEYKSHFYNILGNLVVSGILVAKGYWYILFAFIFTVGVSYSQGVSAYQKYLMIRKFNEENPSSVEMDKSPTRRRRRIIEEQIAGWLTYLPILIGILIAFLIYNPLGTPWYTKVAFTFFVVIIYLILYYFPMYWIALAKKRLIKKGVK